MKKTRYIGAALVAVLWLALAVWAWSKPSEEISEAERRKLAQFPEISGEMLLSGEFMTDFEDYTLDQFPMRDGFRKLKALFHYRLLGQRDNNGIFLYEGYAARMTYPLDEHSVEQALEKFAYLYETYLRESGSSVYAAVVPDKSAYLPENAGYLTLDTERLFEMVCQGMPYATFVDLRETLCLEDYYRTDTHWRQEKLLSASQSLCEAMGVTAFEAEELTPKALERPFYGVYYGQAALPMEAETMYLLENSLLDNCTVINRENGERTGIYDMTALENTDLYDVYLSGAVSLLEIHNPAGIPGKELIVFRDSFGSAMIPLLLQDYSRVTVIDTRYISGSLLADYVDFSGQDVLFLYSTLVLNSSGSLK